MAAAVATLTLFDFPKGVDNTQRFQVLRGTINIGFGTYPVGGFTLNWGAMTNSGGGRVEGIPNSGSSVLPVEVDVQSMSTTPGGFVYVVDSAGTLHVFIASNSTSGTSGPLIEGVGATANVPAALVNDNINFTAYFVRN